MSRITSINAGSSNPSPQAVVRMERNAFHNAGRDVIRNEYNENHYYYNAGTAEGSPQGNPKKGKVKPKAPRNHWLKAKVVIALFKLLKFVKFKRSFSHRKVIINDHSSMDFTFLSSTILTNSARRAAAVSQKRSLAEIYSRSISKCNHEFGCPLYQPDSDLSSELQRTCIKIGDVGVITPDGCFDPLFNVCPSHNRCLNPSKLPDKFEDVGPIEISRSRHNPFRLISPGVLQIHVSPNSYRCTANEGAILELPVGARRIEARNSRMFRELAARHALNWYKYILTDRAIDARNGSLLIVSGYIKSRNWGIAVFDRTSASEDYLHFIADENSTGYQSPNYRWSNSGPALARVGADSRDQDGEPNQCIFLRGYQIALPDKEWDVLTQYSGVR